MGWHWCEVSNTQVQVSDYSDRFFLWKLLGTLLLGWRWHCWGDILQYSQRLWACWGFLCNPIVFHPQWGVCGSVPPCMVWCCRQSFHKLQFSHQKEPLIWGWNELCQCLWCSLLLELFGQVRLQRTFSIFLIRTFTKMSILLWNSSNRMNDRVSFHHLD